MWPSPTEHLSYTCAKHWVQLLLHLLPSKRLESGMGRCVERDLSKHLMKRKGHQESPWENIRNQYDM